MCESEKVGEESGRQSWRVRSTVVVSRPNSSILMTAVDRLAFSIYGDNSKESTIKVLLVVQMSNYEDLD